jgi:hypothetical protein
MEDNFGLGGAEYMIFFGVLAILFLPAVFYLLTLKRTLEACSPENRKTEPNLVWLSLIPLFGIVWQFILVDKIALSLQAEFQSRNIRVDEARPGYTIGMVYCALFCSTIIPILGMFTGIAGFVCWIVYWSKINGYKGQLDRTRNVLV